MSEAERQATEEISARLREAQARPDSPEALASIPTLVEPGDLPRENRKLPCAERSGADVEILLHDLDTTGIIYSRLLLPLDSVPADLLPLLPLYARALTEAGTRRHDYVELGLELAARTGSLDAFPAFHTRLSDAAALPFLEVSGKATADKAGHLAELMQEILTDADLDHAERFTQMVMGRARPSGTEHRSLGTYPGRNTARGRAVRRRSLCRAVRRRELSGICPRAVFPREKRLARPAGGSAPSAQPCRFPAETAGGSGRAALSLTADNAVLDAALPLFQTMTDALPRRTDGSAAGPALVRPGAEGLIVPAQVNYVGLGGNLRDTGYVFHGSALVVLRHLRMGYLWGSRARSGRSLRLLHQS